ncbi:MAG: hypothetical protein AABY44_02945 [Nitrospirota bacterium]
MKLDAKTVYAQSSDIKSRAYLEYRRDMKRKAIAELEVRGWLESLLRKTYNKKSITIEKYGGDRFLWFLRGGGVTQEPDYVVRGLDSEDIFFELQYANEEMGYYDFKRSKVGTKKRNEKKRIPKQNLKFLYLIKSTPKYAILSPEWIIENGVEKVAAAWGSREVYAISNDSLKTQLKSDKALEEIWSTINIKNHILDFQHQKIENIKEGFSHLLQKVVDEEKIVQFLPRSLDSFFKVCFILDNINKTPLNINMWIVYALHFFNDKVTSEELYQILYSVDFLYSKALLTETELGSLVSFINSVKRKLKDFKRDDVAYRTSKNLSPIEDTRNIIFSINLLEDLTQDILFYYGDEYKDIELKPLEKIFENVDGIEQVYEFIII